MEHIPLLSGGSRIFGHAARYRRDRLALLVDVARECGAIGRFRVLNQWMIVLSDLGGIHQVLVTDHQRYVKSPGLRIFAKPLLGEGLLRSEGALWRRQRRILARLFSSDQVDRYGACMVDCARQRADSWRDGETIDIGEQTTALTLSIVNRTLFGDDRAGEADEVGQAVDRAQSCFNDRLATFPPLPLWLPTKANRRLNAALAVLHGRVAAIVQRRQGAQDDRDDVLSRLLAARDEDGAPLDDQQILDEVMNLYVAGHETTAAALAWTLHSLAGNADAYDRVLVEADALGGDPTATDRERLPYTEATIKEALRLYPPAYFFGRTASEPVSLLGHALDVGTTVYMSPYALHRDPDAWEAPEDFRPERFLPGTPEPPRYRFLPFGGGPRVCIGNHFSLLEMVLVLATLSRRIRLERAPGATVSAMPLITLRPKGAAMIVRSRSTTSV